MGILLCTFTLLASFLLGRKSLGKGLGAVIAVGYFYGILRARYLGFTHFIFDFAVLGLYASQFVMARPDQTMQLRSREIKPWVIALAGWPLLLFIVPLQHILIQFVGLRAAIYFLPFLLLGARATERDLDQLARVIAGLNLIVFGFACAEFVLGIEPFFPLNDVTEMIMYRSNDLSGGAYRIPATFSSANAYGGSMVASIPFVLNRWQASTASRGEKAFVAAAIVASGVGIFMAGARLPVVILFLELAVLAVSRKLPLRFIVGLGALGSVVGYFVASSERLQRFTTLSDTEFVRERVSWSVNQSLVDVLVAHPMGAGLGSAIGTSIPYFLQHLVGAQIGLENEYARIAMELSPLGLLLWVGFIIWTVMRHSPPVSRDWVLGTKVMRAFVLISWGTAFIGTGMLTAIPGTVLLLLQMGILGRSRPPQRVRALPQSRLRHPATVAGGQFRFADMTSSPQSRLSR
jgi:hypothetical protein